MDSSLKILTLILMIFGTGCDKDEDIDPTFDLNIGCCESEVLQKYGVPTKSDNCLSKDLIGELGEFVRDRHLKGQEDILVKELQFDENGNVHIFWLTNNADNEQCKWQVISDVFIPSGTQF